ncbi:DUF1573 domain-containing protein [Schleiferia thermophila]|jgi:hypothetical protein|uniref:Uncharacterized protein DUF1573 n=1 Tax=Schleiferia thermophila TaxID=884107 RepID=A0A369A5K1_9FLAO|nr:DUF1573 domain-containing protein [Schleiferia thermophila]KFD38893.1 hypothetical protein AT05_07415 [Schleiferia thermophila str. Yellowstone]PMB20771.1 DUF1573 domain-containing protein [Fischerella thermalis CCMEE 5319]RCX03688.1 uncharacterized protein DUF1573 [Schleiferia thermophila]GCD79922.1 hypothetical protein JCM30197_11690 [Schleiferia thermophila]
MKKLLSTALVVLLAAAAYAQKKNGPIITFEKSELDYGKIAQNSERVREFVIVNTGNEPLIIQNATGSCGCTVPEWPKEPIMPKKKAVLRVNYDTSRIGPFSKTVKIYSNAINNGPDGTVSFTVKGEVLTPSAQAAPINQETSPVMNR